VKKVVSISIVIILLTLTMESLNSSTIIVDKDDIVFTTSQYIEHDPIVIESDVEFLDQFPSLWNEDTLGPDFQCRFPNELPTIALVEGYTWAPRDSFLFTVNVTDPSGVDCVQIVRKKHLSFGDYQWLNYTMIHDPVSDNPNRYTFNYSFQDDPYPVNFHFLANDTLGNYNTTVDYWVDNRIIVRITSDPVYVLTSILSNPFVFSGILGGIVALIVLYRYKKSKIILH